MLLKNSSANKEAAHAKIARKSSRGEWARAGKTAVWRVSFPPHSRSLINLCTLVFGGEPLNGGISVSVSCKGVSADVFILKVEVRESEGILTILLFISKCRN